MKKMIQCKTCGNQIASNAKFCPNCGGKNKKPIYKKWWFWILIGLIIIIVASNLSDSKDDTSIDSNIETVQSEDTRVSSEETPVKNDLWAKYYYLDEFNQETDEWYVTNSTKFLGTFSNSATSDSALTAHVIVDKEDVCIILYEYAKNQVKNAYSDSNHYTIVLKTDDGKKHELNGNMYSDGDRIVVDSSDKTKVINALKGEGNVSFYIYDTDRTVTNYLFTAVTSNFDDLID